MGHIDLDYKAISVIFEVSGLVDRQLLFIFFLGLVSLFADITYEGARSIVGPFLAVLGASGTLVGFVSGFGELVGYSGRLFFGVVSALTRRYWMFMIAGYLINLLAIPLLALAGTPYTAAFLIIAERFGKAIRNPIKDSMLSFATKDIGRGLGFGIHEALDQTGAIIGPLIVMAVLYFKGTYQLSFALLAIPAFIALFILFIAKRRFPNPEKFEVEQPNFDAVSYKKGFWIFVAASCLIAMGYADFALISFHFQKSHFALELWIPLFYAFAMFADGCVALLLGRLLDLHGIKALIAGTILSSLFAPCVFLGGFGWALFGVILWGAGMGIQESTMRAYLATFCKKEDRAVSYGIFNGFFGVFWFLGSWLLGALYDHSIILLVVFSLLLQNLSIPFFFLINKWQNKSKNQGESSE